MGKLALAHPYAKAAFSYASEQQEIKEWSQFLADLSTLISDESIQDYFRSSSFSAEKLWEVFKSVSSHKTSSVQQNFFKLLAETHRVALAKEILEIFEELCTTGAKLMLGEVISARPLTASQKEKITEVLKEKFSQAVELDYKEDPACLAGLKITVGDWVFDNTLKSRFDRLKNTLGESHV